MTVFAFIFGTLFVGYICSLIKQKEEKENERHFGRDPLPPDELREWFEMKRKEHASSSKRSS